MSSLGPPSESFRPDRFELVSETGKNPPVELAPGVLFDCLVGDYNGARNLTTGQIAMSPGAKLPLYTLAASESITLLSGVAVVSVEGREYLLGPLDNITIPHHIPHTIRNASDAHSANLHVAVACGSPVRERASTLLETRSMRQSLVGVSGKEHVTRFTTARRAEAGPGTSFIDHFNQDLMPGIEMSGGYGWFSRGGRLPAHFHDFDESICIIQGTATCIVEGRRYQMSDGSTALQPRGRVHYFINEREEPMAMLWVYAGPSPERIVADERYATVDGNPWK